MNSFTFNGTSSETIGLYVGGQNTFNSPQRDVTKVSVPGRNGDLVRDNGRFLNVQVAYNVVAMNDFAATAMSVRNWLLSAIGYKRLEDTYHPNHYRMARVEDTITFETSAYNATGKAQITFDCKPQRFLKSGEEAQAFSSSGVITNPTLFESRPLIRVRCSDYGSGTVTIGNQIIHINNDEGDIYIDCETMNCYNGVVNKNNNVILGSNGFPVLGTGDTGIDFDGDVFKVDITPRWWEL